MRKAGADMEGLTRKSMLAGALAVAVAAIATSTMAPAGAADAQCNAKPIHALVKISDHELSAGTTLCTGADNG